MCNDAYPDDDLVVARNRLSVFGGFIILFFLFTFKDIRTQTPAIVCNDSVSNIACVQKRASKGFVNKIENKRILINSRHQFWSESLGG